MTGAAESFGDGVVGPPGTEPSATPTPARPTPDLAPGAAEHGGGDAADERYAPPDPADYDAWILRSVPRFGLG